MKKVLAILLCLMFVTLALVSCGDDTISKPEADRPNLTLRMAIVVDDKTTDEGIAAMQKAFNDESEVLLSTRIEFECIKASEYKTRLTELLTSVADAKANQQAGKEDAMANGGNSSGTVLDDEENSYPAASKAQFDIVLIADREMYEDYVERGWLVGLNSHLTGNFKVLNTKLLSSVKNASLIDGECYGIPASQAYGSYKYIVLNKAAADYYNVEVSDVHSLADAYQIITMMEAAGAGNGLSKWQDLYGANFSVIREAEKDFVMPNVQYLSTDFTTPTLLGSTYGYASSIGNVENAKNLLKNPEYARYLTMKFAANKAGYFGNGEAENFLIGLAEGDYALRYSNENYYFQPIMYPTLDQDEIFGGMLAVTKFSVNQKRALEIVQELMTNATRADLLNIALYGDEKTNYSVEDDCVVYRTMSNYGAHPDYLFGNLRELAYPCKNFGQNASFYTDAASQLANLGNRTPLFDDAFSAYFSKVDKEKWEAADAYAQAKLAELMASENLDAFFAKMEALIAEMDANEDFATLEHEKASNDNWTYTTLGGAFFKYTRDRVNGLTGVPENLQDPTETPEGEGDQTGDAAVAQ